MAQRTHIKKGLKFLNDDVPIVRLTFAPTPSGVSTARTFFTTYMEEYRHQSILSLRRLLTDREV